MNAPFFVPTRTRTLLMTHLPSNELSESCAVMLHEVLMVLAALSSNWNERPQPPIAQRDADPNHDSHHNRNGRMTPILDANVHCRGAAKVAGQQDRAQN